MFAPFSRKFLPSATIAQAVAKHVVLASIIVGVVIFLLAGRLPDYELFLVGQLAIDIVVTVALTLLMASAGLLSLASAAFMGVGAYSTAIVMSRWHSPALLALLVATIIGAIGGWFLGLVTLRLSGFQLAIVTFGFLQLLAVGLEHGGSFTGGGFGLVMPSFSLPGLGVLSVNGIAQACAFLGVISVIGGSTVMRSRVGRAWLALRDNEAAARMQGIDVHRMKVLVFVSSSALISLAGGLQGFLLGVASPGSYVVDVSIFQIALVVVGGMTGGLVGAVVAPFLLFFLPASLSSLGQWSEFLYASVLLASLVVMRQGISGGVRNVVERARARSGQLR